MIKARRSIIKDCYSIAPRMRKADIIEITAAGCPNPLEALLDGYSHSKECYTVIDKDNIPHAIFGCCPIENDPTIASIWLLGTDDIFTHRIRFLRESKKYLNIISKPFDLTFNYVHVDNTLHVRWLKWLDFSIIREIEGYGINNENFYEFARLK